MFKKVLLILIITIVSVGVGIYFFNKSKSQAELKVVEATGKIYTLDEVAQHNDANSCWMIIDGKVYDVTQFIPSHPGGDMILLGCGKDATQMYTSRPNDGTSHSQNANKLLKDYFIGTL